jgi:hypothetical protein
LLFYGFYPFFLKLATAFLSYTKSIAKMMPPYIRLMKYLFYQYVRRQIDNKSRPIGLSLIGQFWNGYSWKIMNYQGLTKKKEFSGAGTFGLGGGATG